MKSLTQQEINSKLNIPENGCLKLIKCSVGTTETWNRHFNRGVYNTDSITEIVPICEDKDTGEMKLLLTFINGIRLVFICCIGRKN